MRFALQHLAKFLPIRFEPFAIFTDETLLRPLTESCTIASPDKSVVERQAGRTVAQLRLPYSSAN
jgi:hypothetical protein